MLIVTKNGQSEPITKFNSYEQVEEVNGAFTLSFTSFFHAENHGHDLLENESIIEDNGYSFRVKQSKRTGNYKNVTAISIYFDLIGKRKYDTYGGTKTFNDFMTWVLSGTGWTFTNVDLTDSYFIPNFGNGNVVELVQSLLSVFKAQMKIGPNNTLIFAKQIGPDKDAQYRYGYNITEIYENTDTSNLATVIKGIGSEGLEVTYTSPNASVFGNIEAEPISDDRFTDANSLTERIKQELIDYPETTIELNAIELGEKELGERVWLIHERLGIEFQTQALAIKRRIPATLSTVVIGNRLPRTQNDILVSQRVEIDRNKKETRSRIDQTNETITLEVERIDDSISTIQIQADSIELSVTDLGGRMNNAESSISIQAGQIASKVSQTDYNGNTIASLINQTATTIDIQASKINLVGYVTIGDLDTPGAVVIDEGNIYGNSFIVGRGTGSTLNMSSVVNSHSIHSNDAAGFRVSSNGSLSLQAGGGYGIYSTGAPLVAQSGFRVDSGLSQFQTNVTVNANLNAVSLSISGAEVATKAWVAANFVAQ